MVLWKSKGFCKRTMPSWYRTPLDFLDTSHVWHLMWILFWWCFYNVKRGWEFKLLSKWDIVIFVSVDQEGNVCISILHEPGDDKYGYEKASERWLPIHTVETILVSVISMLADPNDESPANVDAAVSCLWCFSSASNEIWAKCFKLTFLGSSLDSNLSLI